jgi:uncharacterized protein YbjT (DUF2867 family)
MDDPDITYRNVLVIGATGLIGSAIVGRLKAEGARVAVIARTSGSAARRLSADHIHLLDLRNAVRAGDWEPYLQGIDAVINCAGVLQDSGRDSIRAVHVDAPSALFEACARAGVRRIIHFSAMGADKGALSNFSHTKADAEALLQRSELDWVIVRPSVVVGRAAYGGSALFRGLAALPWLPRIVDAGELSIVQLDDVVDTVTTLLRDDAPRRIALDLAGPERQSFEKVVACYRAWLGWGPARLVSLPGPLMAFGYALGDLAGRLGWRPAIRSTARREMGRGAAGDPAAWTAATGIVPRSLGDALMAEPASVQERWFSRLFLLKPLVIGIFAFFWLLTGVVSLGPGYDIGVALMLEGGAGPFSGPVVVAGALADLAIGIGILWRPTTKYALWAAFGITLAYLAIGTVILPRLWAEPLGPMMKVWPILALNLVALAILEER